MKAIHRLTDQQILALGRFIVGAQGTRDWRVSFYESARRSVPFEQVTSEEAAGLNRLVQRCGASIVFGLTTAEILAAANRISAARHEAPLELRTHAPPSALAN